jgi:hypothetical protein
MRPTFSSGRQRADPTDSRCASPGVIVSSVRAVRRALRPFFFEFGTAMIHPLAMVAVYMLIFSVMQARLPGETGTLAYSICIARAFSAGCSRSSSGAAVQITRTC